MHTWLALLFSLILATHLRAGLYNIASIALIAIAYAGFILIFIRYVRDGAKIEYNKLILKIFFALVLVYNFSNNLHYLNKKIPLLPTDKKILIVLAILIAGLGISLLLNVSPWRKRHVLLIALSVLAFNTVLVFRGGIPKIDVYYFFTEGAQSVLRLQNPYTHAYTQIYKPDEISRFYYNDPVFQKYIPFNPYPPVSLLLSTIGYLMGDIRMITVLALFFLPFVIKKICRMALPFLSREETALLSVLPLFHPTLTHLVYESWNDLTVAFFLALFVCFFLARRLTLSYLALAMTFALKQYSVVFFFPFLFILNKRDIRLWLAAIMIIILPLASYAVWNPTAFSESVIMFQVRQPFRADASNIPALLDHLFHIRPLEGLGYPLLLVIQTALSLACSFYVRSKNIIARSKDKLRFVLHISIMQFFTFVFFSKQAFGNYYYLLISMLYLGLLVSVEGEKLTNPLSPSTMPREERRMTTTTGQKKCLAARIKARAAVILSLVLLFILSAAAQDVKPSADGFYLAVSGQSLGFKGDFNGSLVLWHFEMAFFVPALKSATAAGFGLGYKRDGWQWEILYIGSGHRAVLPDREVDSSFHSIELDSRTFLVRDFPLKPYLLLGLSIPWLNVDSGSELYGVRYNAAYIGFGVNLGAGLQWDIAPFLFVNAGALYRLLGYYYVSGEGKGRDITELHVGHEGPTWKSWLKTSSLGAMFGVGLVF